MIDLGNETYVVLEFNGVDNHEIKDILTDQLLSEKEGRKCYITEVAAVKISKNSTYRIVEHFSSYVAIGQYNPHEIEFVKNDRFGVGISEMHLLGAPSLQDVCKRVFDFAEEACLIIRKWATFYEFNEFATKLGYVFYNPTIDMGYIEGAKDLRAACNSLEININKAPLLLTANLLKRAHQYASRNDLFNEYKVFLADKRHDCLSYALANAQLFVNIINDDERPF